VNREKLFALMDERIAKARLDVQGDNEIAKLDEIQKVLTPLK